MEAADTTSANPNIKQSPLCDECGSNPSKYKCPGCSIRSCSLPCVKSHKTRTSCNGKRPVTQFVPISQFDDNLIISDYNLLEEVKRTAESARRRREGFPRYFHFKLPYKLRTLKNAAARRKTHLLLLPSGMSKREKNQSRFNFRDNSISWTIEWRFHSTDVVLIDNGVDENMSPFAVIEKHLTPGPWSNQLRPFYEKLDFLKLFVRKNAKGTKSPFCELDIKAPLSQQLANTVIVEYPVIHVFLPSANFDFEIVKSVKPFSTKSELKESVGDNPQSPKGVLFREEEVEEIDNSDPHILDLMKYMNPELADNSQSSNFSRNLRKEPVMEDHDDMNLKEQGFTEDLDNGFGFEQELKDAFSGFMGEANPDEFLDFDGFVDGDFMLDDELEEGEFPF